MPLITNPYTTSRGHRLRWSWAAVTDSSTDRNHDQPSPARGRPNPI